jgi:hypothetical protein
MERPMASLTQAGQIESLVLPSRTLNHVMDVQAMATPAQKAEVKLMCELL